MCSAIQRFVMTSTLAAAVAIAGCSSGSGMTLRRVDPDFGPLQGGKTVRIVGKGLRHDIGYSVYFGPSPSPRVSILNDRTLTAVTPPRAEKGKVDVTIRADNGESFELKAAFLYVDQRGNPLQDIGKNNPEP